MRGLENASKATSGRRAHPPAPHRVARAVAALALGALAGVAVGSSPVSAQSVDLANLDASGATLFRASGSSGDGRFGVPVAGGFDCNGDGIPDVAMAAMRASPLGRSFAGEVFLVFGDGTLSGAVDTAVLAADILVIAGDGDLEATGSEIWMDDVTGDGIGDLLIARQNYTPDVARPGAGALSIVVGAAALSTHAATLTPLDLRAPPQGIAITTLIGASALDRLGIWVRSGDLSGDTVSDLVIGADQVSAGGEAHRGAAYVVRGGAHLAAGGEIDLASFGSTALAGHLARLDPPTGSTEHHFGATCQIADLDDNGVGEVLVAATLNRAGASLAPIGQGSAHGSGGAPQGRLYIAWDDNFAANPWPAGFQFDVANAPGTETTLSGGMRNLHFGEELVGGVDWDADGNADLFVGDIDGDASVAQNRPASGSGHIFYDSAQLAGLSANLDALPPGIVTTTLVGGGAGDISSDTAAIGDFDGDGVADLAVASPHASPLGRNSAGALHILHGQVGPWPAVIDLAGPFAGLRVSELLGARGAAVGDAGDTLAYSAAAGRIDGDVRVDLITNEMLGNGVAPGTVDVGNLIVVSGTLFVPEPRGGAAFSLLALWGCLARQRAAGVSTAGGSRRRVRAMAQSPTSAAARAPAAAGSGTVVTSPNAR